MTEVAIEMGANPVSAANDMQDVLQFELKLASISTLSGNMCFPCLIGYFYHSPTNRLQLFHNYLSFSKRVLRKTSQLQTNRCKKHASITLWQRLR